MFRSSFAKPDCYPLSLKLLLFSIRGRNFAQFLQIMTAQHITDILIYTFLMPFTRGFSFKSCYALHFQ